MKWKSILPVAMIAMLLAAPQVFAEAQQWDIDKAHSNIYFKVRHTYSIVIGHFGNFSGTFKFDPNDKDASGVNLKVDVPSINTHITKRDNHLRSEEFFDVDKYPHMTFKSTAIKHVEDNRYIIEGDLTIKDVTKRIEVPFEFFGIRDNPLQKGQQVAGFEAEFTINRMDYNVGPGKFLEMGVIGNEVDVIVTMELLQEK